MKQLKWIETLFQRVELAINDPQNYIYEHCYLIRNKIDLRAEYELSESKLEETLIRDIQQNLIEKLNQLQAESIENLRIKLMSEENFFKTEKELISEIKTKIENENFASNLIDCNTIKTLSDWNKYKDIKSKINLIENELQDLSLKLKFKILAGRSVLFEDKANNIKKYNFDNDKIQIFSVYDYKFEQSQNNQQNKIDDNMAERIYIFEHKLNQRLEKIYLEKNFYLIFSKLSKTDDIICLFEIIKKISIKKPKLFILSTELLSSLKSKKSKRINYSFSSLGRIRSNKTISFPSISNAEKLRNECVELFYLLQVENYVGQITRNEILSKLRLILSHSGIFSLPIARHCVEIFKKSWIYHPNDLEEINKILVKKEIKSDFDHYIRITGKSSKIKSKDQKSILNDFVSLKIKK